MITLPKDWKTYYDLIGNRCIDLIVHKIWSGIDQNKFEAWSHNYKTEDEKYFSACVLDSLIYRSNQQTYSLIDQILYRNLNNLFRILEKTDFENFPTCLIERQIEDPLIRLVPAITSYHPVTKSSNEILRFIKRHFRISEKWIINPWKIEEEISKDVKTFIFIDDFLGTGTQFEEVILDSSLEEIVKNNLIVYAPLVAHKEGILYLKQNFPRLQITYSEILDKKSHSFFNNYFPKEQDEAKAFYKELLNQRGISLDHGNEYGFGNLELTFAFEHAAPDNSLQVLYKSNEHWTPLFNR